MKLTTTAPITISRFHKRSSKGSSYKKFLINQKSINGVKREIFRETSPCENSNDSLLGAENNADYLYNSAISHPSVFKFANSQKRAIDNSFSLNSKRHRSLDGKEHELDDGYSFPPSHVTLPNTNSICVSGGMQTSVPAASKAIRRSLVPTKRSSAPVTLTSQLSSTTRNGKVGLQILNQPEQQHRARYQTEGSRGAVKDRTGNSFPVVKVTGYNRPTTLQVFIGSDQGRVTPHMFYQACRVTGKNSTPCVEKNVDGTIVIEIDIEPSKEMTVTCDCVGILKERNVDVEHRFPEECSTRSKKKSTRCRMVFRTIITNDDGTNETLQIASQPIACTQPPGIPEICKKSLTNCSVTGGKELFVLGKNFLKDTHVRFYTDDWEQMVTPDKEFLQQTHLVCVVPAYKNLDISESTAAKVTVISGNRASEPHSFMYTPIMNVASSPLTCSTTNSSSSLRNRLSPIASTKIVDFSVANSASAAVADTASDPDAGLNKAVENVKTPNSPADDCENVNPSVLLWSTSNNQSSATSVRNCTYVQNANSKTMSGPGPVLRPSAISLGRGSSLQMTPDSVDSPGPGGQVLSNISPSAAARSPRQNSSEVLVPHYADGVVSHPMAAAAAVPNYFQPTEAYRSALSGIDPLPVIIPKLEPLSDGCSTMATSYPSQTAPSVCSQFSGVVASGTKVGSPPAAGLTSSTDLYSKSHANDLSVDGMSTFGSMVVGANSVASSGTSRLSPNSTVSSSSCNGVVETSNYAAMVNGGEPTYSTMAAACAAAAMMSPPAERTRLSPSSYVHSDESSDIVNLNESAYDRINVAVDKPKSFQFDQLFDVKSNQQSQQRASYENLHAAAVASGAICFKNTLMGVEQPPQVQQTTALPTYQNYQMVESSMVGSDITSSLTMVKSPALMRDTGGSESSAIDVLGRQCKMATSLDQCSFLNAVAAQKRQSDDQAYDNVNSMLNDNGSVNTMPKLEALVNDAADSHIRSSMELISPPGADAGQTNCGLREPSMGIFMPQQQQQNDLVSRAIDDSTNAGSLLTSYSQLMAPTSNQPMTGSVCNKISSAADSSSLVQGKNTHIATTDKSASVAGLIKKSDDGVFASEITRMTESDILSYFNPSCFDQVGMMTSVMATKLNV